MSRKGCTRWVWWTPCYKGQLRTKLSIFCCDRSPWLSRAAWVDISPVLLAAPVFLWRRLVSTVLRPTLWLLRGYPFHCWPHQCSTCFAWARYGAREFCLPFLPTGTGRSARTLFGCSNRCTRRSNCPTQTRNARADQSTLQRCWLRHWRVQFFWSTAFSGSSAGT